MEVQITSRQRALTAARCSIDTTDDERFAADELAVDTVTLGPSSPVVGRRVRDVPLIDDSDAAVLAVICDETTDLIDDDIEPCRPGDRVVVAARCQRLSEVARTLPAERQRSLPLDSPYFGQLAEVSSAAVDQWCSCA